jgi:hypothetical protein
MSTLKDVNTNINEVKALLKSITKSEASGEVIPTLFASVAVGDDNTAFTLPERVHWCILVSASAFEYCFSSAASDACIPVAANTKEELKGPLDLSTLQVNCLAAASGATVNAWVTRNPAV